MKVSEIFSLGGGCGGCGGCGGGYGGHGYGGYSRYGDYNSNRFGGRSYRRSGFYGGGGRRGRERDREEFLEIAGIGIL